MGCWHHMESCKEYSQIVLYLKLYANDMEYIMLLASSLSLVFSSARLAFANINPYTHDLFAVTMALAILPFFLPKNISVLSYLSSVTVITMMAELGQCAGMEVDNDIGGNECTCIEQNG